MTRILRTLLLLLLAIVLIVGVASAQRLLRAHQGAVEGISLGTLAAAGDVNGDGVADMIQGAPGDGTTLPGSVLLVSGADGTTLLTFSGDAPGDRFGFAVDGGRDVDGDTRPDIVVGAPDGGAGGYVRVFSGLDGSVLMTLVGTQAGGQFGHAVGAAADANGDGRAEILVGAPGEDVPVTDAGAAYLFSGSDGSVLGASTGSDPGEHQGTSVDPSPPDPTKGDKEPGVIIGSEYGGLGGRGLVQVRSALDFGQRFTLQGEAAGDRLGSSVCLVGDVNGDGTGDIGAGATAGGYARVYSGTDGTLLLHLAGGGAAGLFGNCIAGVGDANGDGKDDVAVSEPGADTYGTDSGSVRVYSGADGTLLDTVHGPGAGAAFGSSVCFAGDLDGDGLDDFAAGAPADDAGGLPAAGSVFVMSLTHWEDMGNGLPGIYGIPSLLGQGGLVGQTEATLVLSNARTVTGATLIIGAALYVDVAHGVLAPTPDTVIIGLQTNTAGDLEYEFQWPVGMPSGFTCYYQFVIDDVEGPGGSSRSNTVAAIVP